MENVIGMVSAKWAEWDAYVEPLVFTYIEKVSFFPIAVVVSKVQKGLKPLVCLYCQRKAPARSQGPAPTTSSADASLLTPLVLRCLRTGFRGGHSEKTFVPRSAATAHHPVPDDHCDLVAHLHCYCEPRKAAGHPEAKGCQGPTVAQDPRVVPQRIFGRPERVHVGWDLL